eukprot:10445812-Alexandrium_andersonii.AAC.1
MARCGKLGPGTLSHGLRSSEVYARIRHELSGKDLLDSAGRQRHVDFDQVGARPVADHVLARPGARQPEHLRVQDDGGHRVLDNGAGLQQLHQHLVVEATNALPDNNVWAALVDCGEEPDQEGDAAR